MAGAEAAPEGPCRSVLQMMKKSSRQAESISHPSPPPLVRHPKAALQAGACCRPPMAAQWRSTAAEDLSSRRPATQQTGLWLGRLRSHFTLLRTPLLFRYLLQRLVAAVKAAGAVQGYTMHKQAGVAAAARRGRVRRRTPSVVSQEAPLAAPVRATQASNMPSRDPPARATATGVRRRPWRRSRPTMAPAQALPPTRPSTHTVACSPLRTSSRPSARRCA
mmetsp:Transcript_15083/g.37056  ORF Transcript_15083/g.37056 Transcript_15083/m.37056 type:complete len:220 (-) Transcript_15083:605-1264(-)